MSGVGHNSGATGGIAADKLKSFIERIERLESEKADLGADIREVYDEAKGNGFETKIMRKLIAIRKKHEQQRKEENGLLSLYGSAIGIDPFS